MGTEEEKLALKIYSEYFDVSAEAFLDIDKTESPDIQSTNNNIGIEVTQIISKEEGKINVLYEKVQQCLRNNETIHNIKGIDKYIKSKSIIIDESNNVAFFPVCDNVEPIISAIKTKLIKLQNYKIFKTNVLFMFLKFQMHNTTSIERTIVPIIKKLHSKYEYKFKQYILYDTLKDTLFYIDEFFNVSCLRKIK